MRRLSYTLIDFAVLASVGFLCGCTATKPLNSGNEPTLFLGLLLLAGVGVAVGGWVLAHRHGQLRGQVVATKRVETKQGDL